MQVASALSASTSGKSQVENVAGMRIWLDSMQAASTASKIKHTDVYHNDIKTTLIITVYYTTLTTNIATNKVSCLLYFRTQCKQYTQCVSNWCLQSFYIHTKLTHKSANSNMKFAKLVDPIGMKMPNFTPLCLTILLYQELKEKSTFLHDTA